MSQEFEKIVLEKLNTMDKKLDEHTEILNEHKGILNEHTEILNEHTEQFKKVRKDIYDMNNKIIKNTDEISALTEVVRYNTETIKKFNKDYGKKIDISLSAYEQLNDKVKTNEFMISNLKSKDFQNDIRISALEDIIKKNSIAV